jgi:flagellar hook-associated protein 1 FlgK
MGLGSLLGIASSGLTANAYALDVTGSNVSNVNTPGYSRRRPELNTSITGGVTAGNASRVFDQFSAARMVVTQGSSSMAGARDDALGSVSQLFNETQTSGIADAMSRLFSSMSALAASPDDPTARGAVLSAADSFAGQVRSVASGLASQRGTLLQTAQGTADEINGISTQIAQLNSDITKAKANGGDSSSLEDKRQQLVSDLAQRVDVKVVTDASGQVTILGAGTALVSGSTVTKLAVSTDVSGNIKVSASSNGGPGSDVTQGVSGGKLAGIITARDKDIPQVQAKLDALVTDVGTAVNTQHAAGYGSDGVTGRPLFSFSAAPGSAQSFALDAAMVGHPERLAAAANAAANPGDAGNAAALAKLGTGFIASGGTKTAADAYGDIVGFVGTMKQAADREVDVQQSLYSQAKTMNDSASGVSLDEEMASLSQFQRAYEANAKVLKTADDLLAGLMQQL